MKLQWNHVTAAGGRVARRFRFPARSTQPMASRINSVASDHWGNDRKRGRSRYQPMVA